MIIGFHDLGSGDIIEWKLSIFSREWREMDHSAEEEGLCDEECDILPSCAVMMSGIMSVQ